MQVFPILPKFAHMYLPPILAKYLITIFRYRLDFQFFRTKAQNIPLSLIYLYKVYKTCTGLGFFCIHTLIFNFVFQNLMEMIKFYVECVETKPQDFTMEYILVKDAR